MHLSLDGKRALVCGASRGIGRAVAVALAGAGAEVVALARRAEALETLIRELPAGGGRTHRSVTADMSDPEGLVGAVQAALPGTVHVLVNNSGGPAPGPVRDAQPRAFVDALTQHVVAAHRLAGLLLPGMRDAEYGRIINIISTSVKQPIPGLGVSNTVRGAMASWAKTLAGEVAGEGITVNNVLPGATRTERLDEILAVRAERSGFTVEEMAAAWAAEIPAGRFAAPEEIASAVTFLASPAASYINGINLPVDGGRTGSL
jgi:3-oxoacyl-[acyl-carrier protein] reductase